jgi:hypothetical protein
MLRARLFRDIRPVALTAILATMANGSPSPMLLCIETDGTAHLEQGIGSCSDHFRSAGLDGAPDAERTIAPITDADDCSGCRDIPLISDSLRLRNESRFGRVLDPASGGPTPALGATRLAADPRSALGPQRFPLPKASLSARFVLNI